MKAVKKEKIKVKKKKKKSRLFDVLPIFPFSTSES